MELISFLLLPLMILGILGYGYYKKVDLYSAFIKGAKEGISSSIEIFPFTMSMVFAVNIFLHSGVTDFLFSFLKGLPDYLPVDIFPMALLRSISGSASMVVMTNIFNSLGPDSFAGRLASTIQGSSDTTLYVITLYFGSVGITKIRYALKAGLVADAIGVIMSFILVYLVFGT